MFRRTALALAAGAALAGAAAADPIKIAYKDFKAKSTAEANESLVMVQDDQEKIFFAVTGTAVAEIKIPEDGDYTLTIEASCDEADKEKAKIKIKLGDEVVKESFELTDTDPKEYKFDVKLKKGTTKLSIEFLNDKYKENEYDLNFALHSAKLEQKKK